MEDDGEMRCPSRIMIGPGPGRGGVGVLMVVRVGRRPVFFDTDSLRLVPGGGGFLRGILMGWVSK